MILSVDNYKFYEYDPNVADELIVTTSFQFGSFKCNVEGYTNIGGKYPMCNKRYICSYTRNGKKYKDTCYDTYPGFEKDEIKKSIRGHIEYCYNKNKKGKKIKFE